MPKEGEGGHEKGPWEIIEKEKIALPKKVIYQLSTTAVDPGD